MLDEPRHYDPEDEYDISEERLEAARDHLRAESDVTQITGGSA